MKAALKEKVRAAPKELVRRGLDSSASRLKNELRDAAQQGEKDGYGGDLVEDAAHAG